MKSSSMKTPFRRIFSGWDQARWARNLAAKILRKPEIAVPPRPLGAESVPTPLQKLAANVTIAEPSRAAPSDVSLSEQDWTLPAPFEMPEPAESSALPQSTEIAAAVSASEAPTLQLPVLEEHALEEPIPQESRSRRSRMFSCSRNFGSALDEFFLSFAISANPEPMIVRICRGTRCLVLPTSLFGLASLYSVGAGEAKLGRAAVDEETHTADRWSGRQEGGRNQRHPAGDRQPAQIARVSYGELPANIRFTRMLLLPRFPKRSTAHSSPLP